MSCMANLTLAGAVVRAVEVHPLSSLFSSPLLCSPPCSMLHAPCSMLWRPVTLSIAPPCSCLGVENRAAAHCSPLASGAAVPGPDPFELDGAV
jgi:hypothetical protein